MKSALKILGWLLLASLVIAAHWLDYQWKKKIVRDAIQETQGAKP
jgi:hypothetical protein